MFLFKDRSNINRIEQLENMYSFIKFEIIHNRNLKNTYFLNLCTLEDNMDYILIFWKN